MADLTSVRTGPWKVRWGINDSWFGGTDEFISPSMTLKNLLPKLRALMVARNDLLYDVHSWRGVTISEHPDNVDLAKGMVSDRHSFFCNPGLNRIPTGEGVQTLLVPVVGNNPTTPTDPEGRPDQFRASLLYRLIYDDRREAKRFLVGISDSYTAYEPQSLDVAGNAAYVGKLDTFFALLETTATAGSGWQILARAGDELTPKVRVTGLVRSDATGLLGMQTNLPNDFEADRGNLVQMYPRFVRKQGSFGPSISGEFLVDSVVDTGTIRTVYLQGTTTIDPADWKKFGWIRKVLHQLYPISTATASNATTRKRGAGYLRPVGRSKRRATYDP